MSERYIRRYTATRIQRIAGWARWLLPIIADGLIAVAYFVVFLTLPIILLK